MNGIGLISPNLDEKINAADSLAQELYQDKREKEKERAKRKKVIRNETDSLEWKIDNQLKRYNKAMINSFYLEAICIDYAICENELSEFLFLLGVINKDLIVTKKYRKMYRQIWHLGPMSHFGIKHISCKRNYILNILDYMEKKPLIEFESEVQKQYLEMLEEQLLKNADFQRIRSNFKKMEKFCDERNKMIHGLLKQSNIDLEKRLEKCAKDGYEVLNDLIDIVERFKQSDDIRKKFKIQ